MTNQLVKGNTFIILVLLSFCVNYPTPHFLIPQVREFDYWKQFRELYLGVDNENTKSDN